MSLSARISRMEAQAPAMPSVTIVATYDADAERQVEDAFLSANSPFVVALTVAGQSEQFTMGSISHEEALQEHGS